jgi:hypothetical protein
MQIRFDESASKDVAARTLVNLPRRLFGLSRKLGVTALTSLLCLAVLEFIFRVAGYRALYDIYSKPEIFWRHDPLLGWSMEPDVSGEYIGPRPFPVEFRAQVRINSMGLRGPEPTDIEPGEFRVLLLGDSLVAGFEVDESSTFASLLQERLTAEMGATVQVINAGVRGYGTDQTYLFYRERGRKLRPDVVVFNTANNDLEDNTTLHRARRPFGKPAFSLTPDGSLQLVGSPVPEYPFCSGYRLDANFVPVRIDGARERFMCLIQTSLSDHSALFTFATLRLQQNPDLVYRLFGLGTPGLQGVTMSEPTSTVSPAGKLTTALIRQIAAIARQDGARFLLSSNTQDLTQLDVQALKDDKLQMFSRDPIWADTSDGPLTYRVDSHFNERGHARFAAHLAPAVLENLRAVAAVRASHGRDTGVDKAGSPSAAERL